MTWRLYRPGSRFWKRNFPSRSVFTGGRFRDAPAAVDTVVMVSTEGRLLTELVSTGAAVPDAGVGVTAVRMTCAPASGSSEPERTTMPDNEAVCPACGEN